MSLNLTCAVTEFGNVLGNITVLYKMSSASYGFASYLDAERLADWFLLGGNDASLWRSRVKVEPESWEKASLLFLDREFVLSRFDQVRGRMRHLILHMPRTIVCSASKI